MSSDFGHDIRSDGGVVDSSWTRPTAFYNQATKYTVYTLIVVFIAWSFFGLHISWDRFVLGIESAYSLVSHMWPPDFGERQIELIWSGTVESMAMAIVATVFGVGISIPVAFIAAENLVPKPVYYFGRSLIIISRAFHVLVLALLMVIIFGFGPIAGVAALVFATVGFYGKLLAEEIEDIEHLQLEATRAVGGSRLQVMTYGVLPQVIPRMVGLTIYRWDINLRASTVVGIVGAGGIGITLINAFDRYEYDFGAAILLVIIALVLAGEAISVVIRGRYQ